MNLQEKYIQELIEDMPEFPTNDELWEFALKIKMLGKDYVILCKHCGNEISIE